MAVHHPVRSPSAIALAVVATVIDARSLLMIWGDTHGARTAERAPTLARRGTRASPDLAIAQGEYAWLEYRDSVAERQAGGCTLLRLWARTPRRSGPVRFWLLRHLLRRRTALMPFVNRTQDHSCHRYRHTQRPHPERCEAASRRMGKWRPQRAVLQIQHDGTAANSGFNNS